MNEPVNPSPAVQFVLSYLHAVAGGATGEALAAFLYPDVEHLELPNRYFPKGNRYDLRGMLAAAERGQRNVHDQRYHVRSAPGQGEQVALELEWTGTLAVPAGQLPVGQPLRAQLAIFIELREGRIWRQRNYDAYEAF
jgi:ketosteroid isomerase-like protein